MVKINGIAESMEVLKEDGLFIFVDDSPESEGLLEAISTFTADIRIHVFHSSGLESRCPRVMLQEQGVMSEYIDHYDIAAILRHLDSPDTIRAL